MKKRNIILRTSIHKKLMFEKLRSMGFIGYWSDYEVNRIGLDSIVFKIDLKTKKFKLMSSNDSWRDHPRLLRMTLKRMKKNYLR